MDGSASLAATGTGLFEFEGSWGVDKLESGVWSLTLDDLKAEARADVGSLGMTRRFERRWANLITWVLGTATLLLVMAYLISKARG